MFPGRARVVRPLVSAPDPGWPRRPTPYRPPAPTGAVIAAVPPSPDAAPDVVVLAARSRAAEVGVRPVDDEVGEVLQLLAAVLRARAVVEVGTGTGVSGTHLLRGMADGGVLTSVDTEPEHQRLARATFSEAGFPPQRARLIAGAAADVLPRLTDAHYDLVLLDGDTADALTLVELALRLLRPGGVLAVDGASDPDLADVVAEVRADDRLLHSALPVGRGLLLAVLRA